MAACAREVYYKHNTFGMVAVIVHCLYPPPWINHTILSLEVQLDLCTTTWKYIRRLAAGNYGFHNLQHLTFIVDTDVLQPSNEDAASTLDYWDLLKDRVGDGVDFKCKGKIQLVQDAWLALAHTNIQTIDNATILAFLQQNIRFTR